METDDIPQPGEDTDTDDAGSPVVENDVVEETDPEAEAAAGTEP